MWLLVKQKKWDDIILLSASVNRDLLGATFEEIGRIRKCDPYDAVLDILLEEGDEMMGCMWSSKSFKDTDVDLCLQQNECAVISDTVAIATDGILKDHVGSLSGYGWAARFLAYYVRDRNILSLREALLKITSIPYSGSCPLKSEVTFSYSTSSLSKPKTSVNIVGLLFTHQILITSRQHTFNLIVSIVYFVLNTLTLNRITFKYFYFTNICIYLCWIC